MIFVSLVFFVKVKAWGIIFCLFKIDGISLRGVYSVVKTWLSNFKRHCPNFKWNNCKMIISAAVINNKIQGIKST